MVMQSQSASARSVQRMSHCLVILSFLFSLAATNGFAFRSAQRHHLPQTALTHRNQPLAARSAPSSPSLGRTPKRQLLQSSLFRRQPPQLNSNNIFNLPQWVTLIRVSLPSVIAGIVATLVFPALALGMARGWSDPGTFAVLSQDSSQFVQNFLTVASLLFSILVGQTYYFLYTQQESVYYALFQEVTEAKSLLEQVALVCQGRPSMYQRCLAAIRTYVATDLRNIQADPAVVLSSRPVDDPLESLLFLTSVGVPGAVYETVKSLREARARRLGALQRKLPAIHMGLLWILAGIELASFPLLGAGTQTIGGYNVLTVEGVLFGVVTTGIVLTLRVVGELWRPAGGAYNVDTTLSTMVKGLEEELAARSAGRQVSKRWAPSGAREEDMDDDNVDATNEPVLRQ